MPQDDSKSSSGQEHTTQTVPNPYPKNKYFDDENIDLYELWNTLWNKKLLIITVTVIAALGSVIYALQKQSIYKAEALLLPPSVGDLQSLNFKDVNVSPGEAFSVFKTNLSSRTLQKKFINEYGLMDILAPDRPSETRDIEVLEDFSDIIKIENIEKDSMQFQYQVILSLAMEYHDPEIAANLVNKYISFFDSQTILNLTADTRSTIEKKISDIEYTIASKRRLVKKRTEDQVMEIERNISSKLKIAERRRKDKIIRYEEAARTAKILGISKGLTQQTKLLEPSSGGVSQLSTRESISRAPISQINLDIATASTPLFFMGFNALNAELDNLKSRANDEPFIPGLRDLQERLYKLQSIKSYDFLIIDLRDLQEELSLLRSIKIEPDGIHAVKIDQAAYPPKNHIKPNRRLIVVLSTLFGLFLGIFLVLFSEFLQRQKKRHSG